MKFAIAAALAASLVVAAPRAEAASLFGEQDNFNTLMKLNVSAEKIQEYGLPPEWKDAELVGHSTTLFVFAGVFVSDKGYAIKVPSKDSYLPLDETMIHDLQGIGVLPEPMPSHDVAVIDLLFGYSLWIVIGGLALFYGAKELVFKKKPEPIPAASSSEPPPSA